jgi:hypothetical protein
MMVINRAEGEAVYLGGYVLRVLAVDHDEVVFALFDPDEPGAASLAESSPCADDGEDFSA